MEPVIERRRPTPPWLANVMTQEGGVGAKLIRKKYLTKTDVNRGHGRLLIPYNTIEDKDFLNGEELNDIEEGETVEVVLVDPRGVRWALNLKRWNIDPNSTHYSLFAGWNNVVLQNRLQEGHQIRLWSFHTQEGLYFALVPLQA